MSNNIIKLNGRNYQSWKFQIKRILASRKLNKIVYVKTEDEAQDDTFIEKNNEAQEILAASLEPSVISKVITCEEAYDIWIRLQSVYEPKGEGNVETLVNRFYALKMQENEEVSSYIGKIEELASELESLGEKISDRMLRARLIGCLSLNLMGLVEPGTQLAMMIRLCQI